MLPEVNGIVAPMSLIFHMGAASLGAFAGHPVAVSGR